MSTTTAIKIKKNISTRITFTFARKPELEQVLEDLKARLYGLSQAEITKLALIELDNTLKLRDQKISQAYTLSEDEENSLKKSFESPLIAKKKKQSYLQFLDETLEDKVITN